MQDTIAITQGIYFLLTGLWPLVSITTFIKVTGPKTDLWLVKTVGVLVAVIGAALMLAGLRNDLTTIVVFIAVGSAAVFAGVDILYVARRVISPVYLVDAVLQVVLIAWWMLVL